MGATCPPVLAPCVLSLPALPAGCLLGSFVVQVEIVLAIAEGYCGQTFQVSVWTVTNAGESLTPAQDIANVPTRRRLLAARRRLGAC
jgi:hypothetical protein